MAYTFENGAAIDGDILIKYRSGVGNEELVAIPEYIVKIHNCALDGQSFKSVFVPQSVKSIGDYAFNQCWNLRKITLSEGLTELGKGVFNSCKRLRAIHFPSTLSKIDRSEQPVINCSQLESITVEHGNAEYHAQNNCLIETDAKILISGCMNSVIPADGSVAVIGSGAFSRCGCLKSVDIPQSVTKIGDFAFFACSSLGKAVIPDGVKSIGKSAFEDSAISVLELGNGVETIGYQAFQLCSNLTELTVPDSVTKIGRLAFAYGGLKSLKIGSGLTAIAEGAFMHNYALTSVTLPQGLVSIEKNAFRCCENLEQIRIPSTVTYIGSRAFCRCRKLKDVIIENENTVIAEDAFADCPFQPVQKAPDNADLADFECNGSTLMKYRGAEKIVAVPENVAKIANKAFAKNVNVEEILIHANVSSIAVHAFDGCANLRVLEVDGANKKYRSAGNCIIDAKKNSLIVGCNGSEIPHGVKSIGAGAFEGCKELKTAVIPEGAEVIGNNAFSGCEKLESAVFPSGITSIGDGAFYGCKSLESVSLFSGLESIGAEAFGNCSRLKNLALPEGMKIIDRRAFRGCIELEEIYLPNGLQTLENNAFAKCPNVKSVRIPESLAQISYYAINSGAKLERITVEDGNPKYVGWGNCLIKLDERYQKHENSVICGCKNSKIPEGKDIVILDGCFEDCADLEELVIPEGVTNVLGNAFGGCTGLKRLTVPDSLRYFEVFDDCEKLQTVTAPEKCREYFKSLNENIEFIVKN